MNKRIFDKATKTELFLNKPIKIKYKDHYGNDVEVESNNLTLDLLSLLVADNAVEVCDAHVEQPKVCMDIEFYEVKIGAKFKLTPQQSLEFFNSLIAYSPVTAFSLILKQIAFELDKKYPDHIRESEKVFTISTVNGKITEIPKTIVRSYKNFAAFRTLEDAKLACKITRELLKAMFVNESK